MATIAPVHGQGRAGAAILTMCLGIFLLSLNDAFAKWLTGGYDPLQIVFLRNAIALPVVVAAAAALGGRAALATGNLKLHAFRGLLSVAAAYSFFSALARLPLAEATSLIFAAPIFVTALSALVLGEHVGWRRWSAVIAGFVGVLVIVRPGAAAFQPASLYVLAAAILYASIMISARRIAGAERFPTLIVYMVVFPALFSALAVPAVWTPVAAADLPLFAATAFLGTLGLALMTQAFRMASAAIVAPFDYTALLWATILGFAIWGELPDLWTWAGAAIIVASGIVIVVRETRRGAGPS